MKIPKGIKAIVFDGMTQSVWGRFRSIERAHEMVAKESRRFHKRPGNQGAYLPRTIVEVPENAVYARAHTTANYSTDLKIVFYDSDDLVL